MLIQCCYNDFCTAVVNTKVPLQGPFVHDTQHIPRLLIFCMYILLQLWIYWGGIAGTTPFEKQLQAVDWRVDEGKGPWEGEISAPALRSATPPRHPPALRPRRRGLRPSTCGRQWWKLLKRQKKTQRAPENYRLISLWPQNANVGHIYIIYIYIHTLWLLLFSGSHN